MAVNGPNGRAVPAMQRAACFGLRGGPSRPHAAARLRSGYFPMVAAVRRRPYAELSRLRLAIGGLKKSGSLARAPGNGGLSPQLPRAAGRRKPYRRGQIMIDRGISFLMRKLRAQQACTPRSGPRVACERVKHALIHSRRVQTERASSARGWMNRSNHGLTHVVCRRDRHLCRRSDAGPVERPLVRLHARFALA
jgi:hypothetical protein